MEATANAAKGLSDQQINVLLGLHKRERFLVECQVRLCAGDCHSGSGVTYLRWSPAGRYGSDKTYTRAEAASFSRTLRRLQDRGLLELHNTISGTPRRATEVSFTPIGREVAAALAARHWGDDWFERLKLKYTKNG